MPVAAMCSTTWSKKSGFSGESGPQFGLTVGGRGGSPGWRLQFPSSWLIKKASLRLPSSDGGASNLRRPTLLSKRKRQAKLSKLKDITSVAYMTAQEQLDTNSVRFTWSSWSMPLANVPSAGGSQAAWTVMPTNASGTTCTQKLPRSRSCPFSAQGLRILSNCWTQQHWLSQQAQLQHLFLRAQLHLAHHHQLHLHEALLRLSDLQLCTEQGSVLFTFVLR